MMRSGRVVVVVVVVWKNDDRWRGEVERSDDRW